MTPSTLRQSLAAVSTGWILAYTRGAALYLRRCQGGTYTEERIASAVTSYALSADGGQRALLAYVSRGVLLIRRSSNGGLSFGSAFTAARKVSSIPAAYVGAVDEAVAWSSGSGVYVVRWDTNQWDSEQLSTEPTAGFPAAVGDGAGRLWCAWREGNGGALGYGVYLAEYAGRWDGEGCVTAGMDPALAWDGDLWLGCHSGWFSVDVGRWDGRQIQNAVRLDSAGMFVGLAPGAAVWSRYSEVGDPKADEVRTVAAARWDGIAWREVPVTSATGYQVRPSVAVDAQGVVGVAWVDQVAGEVVMMEVPR